MTALSAQRSRSFGTRKHYFFTLKSGTKAWKGAAICLELSSGKVIPAVTGVGLVYLGLADDTVDATLADAELSIDLITELNATFFVNATAGDAVAAGDVGKVCYFLDDQTVTISAYGRAVAGRVLSVSTSKGVLVQRLDSAPSELLAAPLAAVIPAFVANDLVPLRVQHDSAIDVPATAAASTVTLPAGAPDGTRVYFVADGTKNGHTVQYRDATGPTNLTTALVASKRHLVVCVKRDSKWYANAYVSP
jgi:hypothetical protein